MEKERYTSSRDTPLSYISVATFLNLDARDKDIDMRLLNDSFQDMMAYLDMEWNEDEQLPEVLREAGVGIFCKKHSMYKKAADYAYGDDMEDIIEEKFDSGELDWDDFFERFATIPADIQAMLDGYLEKKNRNSQLSA